MKLEANMDIDKFWDTVSTYRNDLNEEYCKELLNFVHNLMVLPNSSAATERAKLNKNKIS